ncbi:MAG: hypothetical protein FWG61_03065 [Firmicutes bacterium]|nr:hypothetical protein [Bacillota bacterium]
MTLKKRAFVALLAIMMLFAFSSSGFAVTACPDPFPFTQPNGILISVRTMGDEFLSWCEDANGNLIVFDEEKEGYCSAFWTDEGVASTGELIGMGMSVMMLRPATQGHKIPQRVLDKAAQTREEMTAGMTEELAPIDFEALFAPEDFDAPTVTLPVVVPVELMKRKMLMVHVTWEDRSNLYISANNPTVLMPKLTGKQIYDLCFGLRQEVNRSVNGYYQEMMLSDEAVILPAEVDDPLDGYQGVIEVVLPGQNPNPRNTGQGAVMQNAIRKAVAEKKVDLSKFDTDKNGNLATAELAIGFIVDGWESAIGSNSPSFWGVSTSGTPAAADTNGVKIASFFGQGAYHRRTGNIPSDMLITGIIAHEMGHSGYSYQDTYDYGTLTGSNTHTGHGYWSLQTQGSWARKTGENSGTTPGYQDAYNLVRSGHVIPGIVPNGQSAVMNSHLDIYIAQTPITTPELAAPATHPYGTRYGGQFFLLQQRKFGAVDNYDQGCFGSISSAANVRTGGMLIFHNDMAVSITRINDKPTHKRSAIEEAHGGPMSMAQRSGMLEPGATRNNGDLNDLWGVSKIEFSHRSDPGSGTYRYEDGRAWVNALTPAPLQDVPSGVTVTYINWDPASLTTSFMMGYNALPPIIDVQPVGAILAEGTPYELFVEAHPNDPLGLEGVLSYQWFCNGQPIEDAVEDFYALPFLAPGIYEYYVEVTYTIPDNEDGGIKSATTVSDVVTVEIQFIISGISIGNGQANLDFDIVSPNGKGYTVYLSQSGEEGSFEPYSNVNYNAAGAHIKGLTNGVEYFAYVEYYSAGYLCRSITVSFVPSK